jgi:hypothetical protein
MMAQKFEHFMEESDIGSGEKTPAEMEDLEKTKHLREQQELAKQQARPMDGGLLQQVTEEQQYINQQESHTPPDTQAAAPSGAEDSVDSEAPLQHQAAPPAPPQTKKSDRPPGTSHTPEK